jgi:hypothetical protein
MLPVSAHILKKLRRWRWSKVIYADVEAENNYIRIVLVHHSFFIGMQIPTVFKLIQLKKY